MTLSPQTPPGSSPSSVWQHKPWWCQPWSIILTAVSLIGASWLLLHRVWVTGLVAVPVLTWMVFFVGIYPKLMADSGMLTPEE
jgi:membrane protein YdbS with pleckstrin-like domain